VSAGRFAGLLAAVITALILVGAASLLLGGTDIPASHSLSSLLTSQASVERTILVGMRLPRVVLAVLVGAGLAAAGAAYQGIFLNPLADPFVIGASSGAAVGATVTIVAGWQRTWGAGALPACAFLGAMAAIALVYLLGGYASSRGLLLAGAAVSTIIGSLVSLLMILHDQSIGVVFNWLLGSLAAASWHEVAYGAPMIGCGVVALFLLCRPLDALALGDETAASLGLPATASRLAIVLAATLTTAAAVSVSGIIGFIGLVAPHAARLLVGGSSSRVLVTSCLLGALLLLVADDAARALAPPLEIPVSIVTALVGGPFFLFLLRRAKGAGDSFQ
jgi:iron complex transport system permease protein